MKIPHPNFGTHLLSIFLLAASSFADEAMSGFVPGEVSEYKITWLTIPLAWSRSTTDTIKENDRELIRLRMVSKTYRPYTYIYEVNDVTEVIIDPETGLPIRQDIELHEGDRHKSHFTTFDHANRTATFIDRVAGTTNTIPIEANTLEIYTYIYSLRNQGLEAISKTQHTLYVDGAVHDFSIKIGKEKKIKLPDYGKIRSIAVEPIAKFNGLFLREGKIIFWVSKEQRRMITCIQARVPVGRVTVKLQQVSGPGNDFWVRSK